MKKFSILICTRNRAKLLEETLNSISKNTKYKKNIEVLIAVDKDDIISKKTIFKFKRQYLFTIKTFISPRGSGYRDNPKRLINLIKISSGLFFIFFADDMIMKTKNWDIELQNQLMQLPYDEIYLLTPQHNQGNKNWPICQIISKKWFKITNKFSNCYETDTELMIISNTLKRFFICKKIRIFHNLSSRKDITFKEGRNSILKKKIYKDSVNSLQGFLKILLDLHKINVQLHNYGNFRIMTSLLKVFLFDSIKIIFKFKINLLRSLY
jgi:hypothetical protein